MLPSYSWSTPWCWLFIDEAPDETAPRLASSRSVCQAWGMLPLPRRIGSFNLSGRSLRLAVAGAGFLSASIVLADGRPKATGVPDIRYEVVASADAADLRVEVDLPAGLGSTVAVDPVAAPFIDGAGRYDSGKWVPVNGGKRLLRVPECQRSGCRLRYVFHLRAAAEAIDDPDTAAA